MYKGIDGTSLIDEWVEALEEAVSFKCIPGPSSQLASSSRSGRLSIGMDTMNYGFSMNSGLFYSCAGDVIILLKTLESLDQFMNHNTSLQIHNHNEEDRCSHLLELYHSFNMIFNYISNITHNKDGCALFGERLEDLIRVMFDTDHGVFHLLRYYMINTVHNNNNANSSSNMESSASSSSNTNTNSSTYITVPFDIFLKEHKFSMKQFSSLLGTLNKILYNIINFMDTCFMSTGWLLQINNKKYPLFYYFNLYDSQLVTVVNKCLQQFAVSNINNYNKSDLVTFTAKKYNDNFVDVKRSITALGGFETIYNDPAKVYTSRYRCVDVVM